MVVTLNTDTLPSTGHLKACGLYLPHHQDIGRAGQIFCDEGFDILGGGLRDSSMGQECEQNGDNKREVSEQRHGNSPS
jgi:hypothetical protein